MIRIKKKSWPIVANKKPHNNYEKGCSFPKYMIVVMEMKEELFFFFWFLFSNFDTIYGIQV